MRIKNISLRNFQSYESLEFSYENLGLALVAGDTGAGKSTIMDAVSWGLFGCTSKDGAADDVKSWEGGLTEVVVNVDDITVTRIRGTGKNDLYWTEWHRQIHRGKDLSDTQRLLDERLGCTADTFLTASYLTQFSKADIFFIAKAKDRREVLEKIADQEFAISLGEKSSAAKKAAKKEKEALDLSLSSLEGRLKGREEALESLKSSSVWWTRDHEIKVQNIEKKHDSFDTDKTLKLAGLYALAETFEKDRQAKLKELNSKTKAKPMPDESFARAIASVKEDIRNLPPGICDKCGSLSSNEASAELNLILNELILSRTENAYKVKDLHRLHTDIKALSEQENPYSKEVKATERQTNPHGELLKSAMDETNPFRKQVQDAIAAIQSTQTQVNDLTALVSAKTTLISQLTWLYDKSFELRSLLMAKVVNQIEHSTNNYLERFFDATLRVKFVLEDADKLEVEIHNQGHACGFKALSGGERTMLKLSFSLSLMKAAQEKAGITFGQIFLDEPLNGLSESLKVKAFGLFQQLLKDSPTVLVVEHSNEFKAQFDKTFLVTKIDGRSSVAES